MAKVNVDTDTFPNLVVAYLFDKLINPNDVSKDNELFNQLMNRMDKKGMKALLRQYYLEMNPNYRQKYKRIQNGFRDGSSENQLILVVPKGKGED